MQLKNIYSRIIKLLCDTDIHTFLSCISVNSDMRKYQSLLFDNYALKPKIFTITDLVTYLKYKIISQPDPEVLLANKFNNKIRKIILPQYELDLLSTHQLQLKYRIIDGHFESYLPDLKSPYTHYRYAVLFASKYLSLQILTAGELIDQCIMIEKSGLTLDDLLYNTFN